MTNVISPSTHQSSDSGRSPQPRDVLVVGVDGSSASRKALDFAIGEAQRRHATLELYHAFDIPIYAADPTGAVFAAVDQTELHDAAEAVVRREAQYVAGVAPDLGVQTVVRQGSAGALLVEASKRADMVVVGAAHHSALARLVMGSVSHNLLHHAACPVAIVPSPAPSNETE